MEFASRWFVNEKVRDNVRLKMQMRVKIVWVVSFAKSGSRLIGLNSLQVPRGQFSGSQDDFAS